jgi:hypothetical protein
MKSRRLAILSVAALGAVGAGAAIAATQDDKGKEVEDAILSDAAGRLDVEADELRTALSEAQLAQIDRAVEAGDLTEQQAERIKQHLEESGRVLGFPGGPHPHGPGGPGGPEVFDAIAAELGISVEKLHSQLMNGKSMRKIANANGKTLADVKGAARAAIEKKLAEDVEAGRITEEQAEQIREDLPRILNHLVRGPRFHRGGPGGPRGFGGPGGPPPGAGFGPPPPPREFGA